MFEMKGNGCEGRADGEHLVEEPLPELILVRGRQVAVGAEVNARLGQIRDQLLMEDPPLLLHESSECLPNAAQLLRLRVPVRR